MINNGEVTTGKLADGAVTPEKTSFLEVTRVNLYDESKAMDGYAVDSSGNIVVNHNFTLSDLMPSEPNTVYYFGSSEGVRAALSDKDNNFLGLTTYNQNPITTTEFTRYVRIISPIGNKETEYFSTVNEYHPYDEKIIKVTDQQVLEAFQDDGKLKGKTGAFIGDSLTQKDANNVTKYHTVIANETGLKVVDLGVSGTGYLATNGGTAENICTRIDNLTGLEGFDYITIMAGINDAGGSFAMGEFGDTSKETLAGAVYYSINTLINKFPNAEIGVVTPTPTVWSHGTGNEFYRLSEIIKKTCNYFSVPCLDLNGTSGMKPWNDTWKSKYMVDSTHLNDLGQFKYLAPPFKSFLVSF